MSHDLIRGVMTLDFCELILMEEADELRKQIYISSN